MSLTSFLQRPEVKSRFLRAGVVADKSLRMTLAVRPMSDDRSLIGLAFGCLMRLLLQRLNRIDHESIWVGPNAFAQLLATSDLRNQRLTERLVAMHGFAVSTTEQYVNDGALTEDLLRATIYMAYLERAFRTGRYELPPDWLEKEYRAEIEELRELYYLIPSDALRATRQCVLNPSFGPASWMMGGADADFVVDDAIIECKTTASSKLDENSLNQVLAYYLLALLNPNANGMHLTGLKRIVIYFARSGYLYSIRVDEFLGERELEKLIRWIVDAAVPDDATRCALLPRFSYAPCRDWWLEIRGHTPDLWSYARSLTGCSPAPVKCNHAEP